MLKISFISETAALKKGLALTVNSGKKLGKFGKKLDAKFSGAITKAMKASRSFTGEKGQTLHVFLPSAKLPINLILVGIGSTEKLNETEAQRLGGSVFASLQEKAIESAALAIDVKEAGDTAAQAAFGALLRSYRFDKYRTKIKPEQKPSLKNLYVACAKTARARAEFSRLNKIAQGVFFARDMVSEPANSLYPETLAERCVALKALGVNVQILDEKRMEKLGMGALLGVARGSSRPARLAVMEWKGDAAAKNKRPVVFVGKGVTFDTGGISLKPPAGMEDMKWDMAGAGAVIGAMMSLASRKAKANVVGIAGLVENMPSGEAQRPGDVVRSMSGQTIEVINTDAEGRLVLADAIWYAQEKFNPRCVVDLATLTGAILIALGHEYAGLFSNDDVLAKKLYEAGETVDEHLWRFPMHESFDKSLDSQIADVKNISGNRDAGSIVGAQFIQRFVKKGVQWAHLDIAGMAWQSKDRPCCPKGATAFGVRLLDRFVSDNFEPPKRT